MYENAFEKLRAGTNYGTKNIAQQVQLLYSEGISREETEPYRLYLLIPENYLYDELLTLRDSDYDLSVEDEEKEFEAFIKKFTGVKSNSINIFAAFSWYNTVKNNMGDAKKITKTEIKKAIGKAAKDDPWYFQGAAAICTRAAMKAEKDDPSHAPKAWDDAFDWWQKFFAEASAESSCAYKLEKDQKKKEQCLTAWKNFRNKLAKETQKRCYEYIAENDGRAASACLNVLKSSNVRQIEPNIFDETSRSISLKISKALKNCPSFAEALSLWEGLGDTKKLSSVISAMLSAMSAATEKIETNPEIANLIDEAMKNLNRDADLSHKKSDNDIAPALNEYYIAVSATSNKVLGDNSQGDREEKLKAIKKILLHIPAERVVGQTATGSITAEEVLKIVSKELSVKIFEEFALSDTTKPEAFKIYNDLRKFAKKNTDDSDLTETFDMLSKQKIIECVNNYSKTKDINTQKLGLEISRDLPSDTEFPSVEGTISLKDVILILEDKIPPEFEKLEKFALGDPTDKTTLNHFNDLKAFIKEKNHTDRSFDTAYQNALTEKIYVCLASYISKKNYNAISLINAIAEELPQKFKTKINTGERNMALDEVLKIILNAEQAGRRVGNYNSNRYTPPKKSSWSFSIFFASLAVGLTVPAIAALVIWIFHLYPLAPWFKVLAYIYGFMWIIMSIAAAKIQ